MEELIDLLHSGGYSCVIANKGKVRTFTQRGVADLYDLLTQEPEFLKHSGGSIVFLSQRISPLPIHHYHHVTSVLQLNVTPGGDLQYFSDQFCLVCVDKAETGWCVPFF